jgi:hypothetical protein
MNKDDKLCVFFVPTLPALGFVLAPRSGSYGDDRGSSAKAVVACWEKDGKKGGELTTTRGFIGDR